MAGFSFSGVNFHFKPKNTDGGYDFSKLIVNQGKNPKHSPLSLRSVCFFPSLYYV